ncbi:MBL fold metallo-hydrolase [Paraburkholderia monticola]|uniref:MBL fold metallo-hydrolase n=1 Tax=Paraburkholderia monticola TaxID=1399968 RepID=A0A149PB23_9BURK|nr:MBL fold metallo-hydrolase [Paraburkholderia monticola]KXU82235.1 MBL fold metallo-hydrolase [Paraburkholderia monticola]
MDRIQRYRIGDATVTRVTELILPEVSSAFLFPDRDRTILTHDRPRWIGPENVSADGETLALSVHSWIVQTGRHTIVIDTGAGNGKRRPLNPIFDQLDTPYLERLAAIGIKPEQVDFVLVTHLHVDHVGWNTVRDGERWVPTFPNAQYVFSEAEYRFYAEEEHVQTPSAGVFEDSVQPIVDAGQALLIDAGHQQPLDGFTFHRTKGHSFDHLSISLTSNGERALFAGDVMHHPVQVAKPEWNSVFCEFQDDARASRLWALNFAADHGATFFSSHFPGTSAGTVGRADGGFVWFPR